MSNLQKILLGSLAVITVVLAVVVVKGMLDGIDRTNQQVTAVAEDLGCTVIEQSYYHPERFYIDCGNDEIRIIKVENK